MVIYFDNAATTYPKPEEVYQAQDRYLRQAGNPGRGAHRLSLKAAQALFETRCALAKFLGVKSPERLIFTSGCTQAINMALKGLRLGRGDVVVVSALEHNAVMRPLRQLERCAGVEVKVLPYAASGVVCAEDLAAYLERFKPRLCVVAEASNVTGELVDLPVVAELCAKAGTPLMVDAAQSAGWTDARLDEMDISIWCASGHKGLMGPPGAGLIYVSPGIDLEPLVAGGTGSASEQLEMPPSYPDHLEAGTLAGPAIAGLGAGVAWLEAQGVDRVRRHEIELAERFIAWATGQEQVCIYGPGHGARRTGIVAFRLPGLSPDVVADRLDAEYDIAVRPGLHCAALAHKSLGTLDSGLVRASFGYFNTVEEVDKLCQALEALIAGGDRVLAH